MSGRRAPTVGVVVLLVLGGLFVGSLFLLSALMGSMSDESGGCDTVPAGPAPVAGAGRKVGDLTPAQLANAQAVVAEGRRMQVPVQGIVVALATASQESGFTNYANDGRGGDLSFLQRGIERSLSLPHEAVGSDHGSIGIFQQQWPWWGTMSQLMDPTTSAHKFYESLLAVPGWQSMPVTVAAQRVQRSAFPDAYADDEALARQLLGSSGSAAATSAASFQGAASSGAGCVAGVAARGPVVYPLPKGSGFRDNHNFGNHGGMWSREHTGTDLSVACGTPVLAATAGTVVVRTDQPWAGHWLVQVSTGVGQLTTWYGHMRALDVTAGQTVRAGQQIGEVGDLGNATGCHLHFEVHPQGGSIYRDSVDPSPWLAENVGREDVGSQPVDFNGDGEAGFTLATFNVLGGSHTSASGKAPGLASGRSRAAGVVDLLDRYGVDVAGLQELQRPQWQALATLAGSTYATYSAHGDTENAIAYRRDRWTFVRGRTFPVPYFDGHPRHMPIVRLRDRDSGQEAVFVNVHNPADTRRFPAQGRWRAEAVAREAALVQRLSRQGAPVFLTGDMNDRHDVYCALTAGNLAESASGSGGPGCHPPQGAQIDWIFGRGGVRFTNYTVDRGPLHDGTSDHPFVVARVVGGF
ncbi:MAG: peptidoglycan DD-metalloendopeptidase family protein [Nocardioidaceae bacterium]|nr:peptidoglycan DD-metalloendopeptidase family protein [Nocardioidaceae bacterium]